MMDTMDATLRTRGVSKLPVELLRSILAALPDVDSLYASIRSSPLWYHAFTQDEATITSKVLLKKVDVEIMPELLSAVKSSSLRPPPREPGSQSQWAPTYYIAHYLHQGTTLPRVGTLRKALEVYKVYKKVQWFTEAFFNYAYAASLRPPQLPDSEPSPSERWRVNRAFCRFTIYCNLFRSDGDIKSPLNSQRKSIFFDDYPPWEHEQLACVYDFLARFVSLAIDEVAVHDKDWAACYKSSFGILNAPQTGFLLSFGLGKVREVVEASSYEERCTALNILGKPWDRDGFLFNGLENDANEANGSTLVANVTRQDFETPSSSFSAGVIVPPAFPDTDTGPFNVWKWVHQEESSQNWVNQYDRHYLRHWGYVMCDQSRLDASRILEDPWVEDEYGIYMQEAWEEKFPESRVSPVFELNSRAEAIDALRSMIMPSSVGRFLKKEH